jgi:hypothetical protein
MGRCELGAARGLDWSWRSSVARRSRVDRRDQMLGQSLLASVPSMSCSVRIVQQRKDGGNSHADLCLYSAHCLHSSPSLPYELTVPCWDGDEFPVPSCCLASSLSIDRGGEKMSSCLCFIHRELLHCKYVTDQPIATKKMPLKKREKAIMEQGPEHQREQARRSRRERQLNARFSGPDWTT